MNLHKEVFQKVSSFMERESGKHGSSEKPSKASVCLPVKWCAFMTWRLLQPLRVGHALSFLGSLGGPLSSSTEKTCSTTNNGIVTRGGSVERRMERRCCSSCPGAFHPLRMQCLVGTTNAFAAKRTPLTPQQQGAHECVFQHCC